VSRRTAARAFGAGMRRADRERAGAVRMVQIRRDPGSASW